MAASALRDSYLGKEGGRPCLVGPTALSAGTLEEGLVLKQLSVAVAYMRNFLRSVMVWSASAKLWQTKR